MQPIAIFFNRQFYQVHDKIVLFGELLMYEKKIPVKKRSGVDVTFYFIEGKWKRDIILCLNDGIKRPIELQKHLAEAKANARVLNQQFKELEKHGIIYKKIYPSVPPKVEYNLTEIGKDLIPLFKVMEDWGNNYSRKESNSLNGSNGSGES